MSSQLSVFIPHVFINIDKDRIKRVFHLLCLGNVSNIDFVLKIDAKGNQYNAAYVHFERWYNNKEASRSFQSRVINSSEGAKLVYDDPWYWVVLENKAKKHLTGAPKRAINLDYAERETSKVACRNLSFEFDYEEDASLDSLGRRAEEMDAWSDDEDYEEDGDEEDEEMEQILDEMDETEQLMTEGTFDYVDASYASTLELDRMRLTQLCKYYKSDNNLLRREIQDIEELKKPFFDELQTLRAHIVYLKEVLAQYEPDERKQNKELYH